MAGNRIVYTSVILMCTVFVLLFEHEATYTALYAVLLMPVLSLIILIIAKRFIIISENLDIDTVKKGEPTEYFLNADKNIFKLKIKIIFDKSLNKFAQITGTGEQSFKIICRYRGNFNISAKFIYIYDFLGLFKLKIKNNNRLNLKVLPDISKLENMPGLFSNQGSLKSDGLIAEISEDYSDSPDFKKHEQSDGFKRIHWQLSARRGELISKNYNTAEKSAAAVIIDNSELNDIKREDIIIDAAVSLTAYLNSLGQPVYLDYIGGISSEATLDFNYIYMLAADINFNGHEFDKFAESIAEMRRGFNIYIINQEGEIGQCLDV